MAIYESSFSKGITSDNPWWSGKKMEEIPDFKRSDYDYYKAELEEKRVTVLIGPRRVGKTTLIQQIISCLLYEKKADPKRIFFISLERPFFELHQQKLSDAISFYEENILNKSISDSKEKIYLFIDEAHFDPLWSRLLKQYVDQKLPIHAIVSGSSAAALFNNTESGAGRFHLHQMVTMKFRDVARFKDSQNENKIRILSKNLKEALLKSFKEKKILPYWSKLKELNEFPTQFIDLLKTSLNEYLLKGGYPEFYSSKDWSKISRYYQSNVFDIILQKDVVTISNIRQPMKVRTLMVLIAQYTARQLTREKIAQSLVLSSIQTVDQYIDALSEAFLIRTSSQYRPSGFPSTKSKKFYAADTGLRNAILGVERLENDEERGALLETAVFNHTLRLQFSGDRQLRYSGFFWLDERECDILIDMRKQFGMIIPIEVKNGECGQEDILKMKFLVKKFKSPFGLIICKDQLGVDGDVMIIPAWIFLLSC